MPEPTGAQAEFLLAQPKQIGGTVIRRPIIPSRTPRWRLETTVVAPTTLETLRLVGSYGRTNWSFALLVNTIPIRRLTMHGGRHTNPDGTVIEEPHKHIWDDLHRDREAYVPTDIDFSDVNEAFFDFLKECGITLMGQYQPLMTMAT